MKAYKFFIMSSVAICLCACKSNDDSWLTGIAPEPVEDPVTRAVPIELTNTQQEIGNTLHEFSWKLFGQFFKWKQEWHSAEPNTLMSPFSMVSNLSILMNGMDEQLQESILGMMGLKDFTIEDVNAFFKTMEDGISKADPQVKFLNNNLFQYDSNLTLAEPFGKKLSELSVKVEATKVANMLDYQSFCNTGFYGNWERKFSTEKTEKAVFHNADGTEKEVNMMFQELVTYYLEHETFTAARIKLNSGAYDVFFILPKEGVDMKDLIANIKPIDLKYGDEAHVSFWLPKFKVTDNESLDLFFLKEIGFDDALSDGLDFFVNHKTELSNIIQDSSFSIDEEGVEAVAETTWDTAYHACNVGIEFVDFRLDHPFIYGIVETSTNMPLFIGYYGN